MVEYTKLHFYCIVQERMVLYTGYILTLYTERVRQAETQRQREKRSESLHIVIIVISAFLINMIYSNKMFLIKNGNMLAIISFKSDHLRISGQSVKSILKVKVLEK